MLFDDNGISIDGPLSLSDSVDQVKRFEACRLARGARRRPRPKAIAARHLAARRSPTGRRMIACKTTIGYGAPKKAGTSKAHGEPLGAEELAGAKATFGWSHPPFEIPDRHPRRLGEGRHARAAAQRKAWDRSPEGRCPPTTRAEFERRMKGVRPQGLAEAVAKLKDKLVAEPQNVGDPQGQRDRARGHHRGGAGAGAAARPT